MSGAAEPGLRRPVRRAFAAALAIYLGIAAWLVWRTSILEPYSDMFDWIMRWRVLQAGGGFARYIWAPHNFHHLIWTLGVLALDVRAFGASSYLFLAVGVACLAATAAMLADLGAAAAGRGLRLVGGGGAAALCLMGCNVLDASADINTTYVHALAFAVAAIWLAEKPGGRSWLRLGAALACGVAAGLGSAAGLAVWPALLFAAVRRRDRRWAGAVLATGAVFSLVYLLGEALPAAGDGAGGVGQGIVGRIGEAVALFINYLGLPWVRGVPGFGWVVGVGVLGLSSAALVFRGGAGGAWPERAAVALIVFSLATAVMAALARTGLIAPDLVPIRYAVFVAPAHVGLWILALPHLRRAWERRPQRMEGVVAAAAAAMLLHQAVMAVYAVRTADANLRVVADFRAGMRTPAMLTTIYSDLDKAQALSAWMKREGLYQRELRPDPAP